MPVVFMPPFAASAASGGLETDNGVILYNGMLIDGNTMTILKTFPLSDIALVSSSGYYCKMVTSPRPSASGQPMSTYNKIITLYDPEGQAVWSIEDYDWRVPYANGIGTQVMQTQTRGVCVTPDSVICVGKLGNVPANTTAQLFIREHYLETGALKVDPIVTLDYGYRSSVVGAVLYDPTQDLLVITTGARYLNFVARTTGAVLSRWNQGSGEGSGDAGQVPVLAPTSGRVAQKVGDTSANLLDYSGNVIAHVQHSTESYADFWFGHDGNWYTARDYSYNLGGGSRTSGSLHSAYDINGNLLFENDTPNPFDVEGARAGGLILRDSSYVGYSELGENDKTLGKYDAQTRALIASVYIDDTRARRWPTYHYPHILNY